MLHIKRMLALKPALLVALFSACALDAQAQGTPFAYISYGSTAQGGTNFGSLNLQTGAITAIGSSAAAIGGLGYGTNGSLYGLASDGSLYTINVANGATTLVGATGSGGESDWGMGSTPNGTLYAYEEAQNVYTLNQTTGARTLLGSQGFTSSGNYASNAAGVLYSTQGSLGAGFYSINTTTGAGTKIGTLTDPGNSYALAFFTNTLYGIDDTGDIYTINTTNAAHTDVATYNKSAFGIVNAAITGKAAGAAPEPGSVELIAISGLPVFGILVRRRRAASYLWSQPSTDLTQSKRGDLRYE